MLGDSFACRIGTPIQVQFGKGRVTRAPTVVEDSRDMVNAIGAGLGHNPESEIVVLATLKTHAQPPQPLYQRTAIDSKMIDHIVAEEKIMIPFWLEVGSMPVIGIAYLIFIGVNEVCVPMRV